MALNSKKQFHQYTEEALANALKKIREENWAIRKASREYGIPRGTLQDRIHGRVVEKPRKMGPETILKPEEEKVLADWLSSLAKCGFPQKPTDLLNTVQKIIRDDKRKTPFKDDLPGKSWYYGFLKRHPELSLRTPEGLSKGRAIVTEESVRKWFRDLKEYLVEINASDILDDPCRIFNGDETSFCLSPKTGTVLAPRGWKNLYKISSGNDRETITVLFVFSADGQMLPPLVVFPYVRPPQSLIKSIPDKWVLGRSESGWMRSETFFEYVANSFDDWVKENNIKRPILFLVDGHKSHLTMELSDFCRNNGIILYALLPNTTHITQPADVGAFKGLKTEYKNTVHKWQQLPDNRGKAVTKANFCDVLKLALDSSDRTETIKNAFRKCGLYPFNPDAIDFTKCVQNELEKYSPAINTELVTVTNSSFCEAKKVLALAKDEILKQNINFSALMEIIEKLEQANLSQPDEQNETITGTYLIGETGELEKITSEVSSYIVTPPSQSPPINDEENNNGNEQELTVEEVLLEAEEALNTPIVHCASRSSSMSSVNVSKLLTKIADETQNAPCTPSTSAAISPAFGRHLFFPEKLPKSTKPNREKPPSSVSSLAWKEFFNKKEEEKERKLKAIEQRKQFREQKRVEAERKKRSRKQKKTKKLLCSKCEGELISDTEDNDEKNVGCDSCVRWFHLKCTIFSGRAYEDIEKEIFACEHCTK